MMLIEVTYPDYHRDIGMLPLSGGKEVRVWNTE